MGNPEKKDQGRGGFFAAMSSGLSMFSNAVNRSVGGVEVINPDGGKEDAEEEAQRGRWKQEERDGYWRMMQKYIGSDITSMVTLPVLIFEPMTMLQKMAELMEYAHLLDEADKCEDPYMRMMYASTWAVSVYFAYQRTWKPFNPILGETYEMVNHDGITFLSEQISHHPPMSAGHAENEHFTYEVTSKLRTKFLGNSVDVYPVGRANRYEVDGYVYNANEEPKILMTGKWSESMSYQPCDSEGEPLPGTELKEVWHVATPPPSDKFQFTHFAHKLNSFDTAPKKLLASDSRLRPDRWALERAWRRDRELRREIEKRKVIPSFPSGSIKRMKLHLHRGGTWKYTVTTESMRSIGMLLTPQRPLTQAMLIQLTLILGSILIRPSEAIDFRLPPNDYVC